MENIESERTGYCIRTGKLIPFNLKNPLAEKAFDSWVKFNDKNYPEKFCHFSEENTNGENCFAKPILTKNWNEAKKILKF